MARLHQEITARYVRLFAAGYIIIFFDIDQNRKP